MRGVVVGSGRSTPTTRRRGSFGTEALVVDAKPVKTKSRSTGELRRATDDQHSSEDSRPMREMCLVVEAVAPQGIFANDLVSIVLPAGGMVVARSPVSEGCRFRVVVTEADTRESKTASPIALLERELEEDDGDEESTALPLGEILKRERWAPYFLDFAMSDAENATDGRLVLLYLECEQHKGLKASDSESLTRLLRDHEASVYETYVARDAPKFACRGLNRSVLGRLERRNRRSEEDDNAARDALSELGDAVLLSLHAQWYPKFLASDSYKKLLAHEVGGSTSPRQKTNKDGANAPSTQIAVTLDDAVDDSQLRRHLIAAQTKQSLKRSVNWWCRIRGRLLQLCRSTRKLPRGLAEQARAEVRGNVHRLLVRPPIDLSKELKDRLMTSYRRDRDAFELDTACSMYADVLADVADEMRPVLLKDAWLPFVESTGYAEYLVAVKTLDDRDPFDLAVEHAVDATRRSNPPGNKNPFFVRTNSDAAKMQMASASIMTNGVDLICIDLRATRDLFDDDDPRDELTSEEESTPSSSSSSPSSPLTMTSLRDAGGLSSSPRAAGWLRSASDQAAVCLGLLTICNERFIPRLITALLLHVPIGVKSTDKKRRAKIAKRLRDLSDALPHRRRRMQCDDSDNSATMTVCRTTDEVSPEPLFVIEDRECEASEAVPEPPARASRQLVKAVRAQQFRTLHMIDASADETNWRQPLPVLRDDECVHALDEFIDEVFFRIVRLFATRPSEYPNVVSFDLKSLNALTPKSDLRFYHALLLSDRFADALVDACFWHGAGPESPNYPTGPCSWILPNNTLDNGVPANAFASTAPVSSTTKNDEHDRILLSRTTPSRIRSPPRRGDDTTTLDK